MTTPVFDFDRSMEAAWARFAVRLSEVLSMMDDTEPLTLTPADSDRGWYVRFHCRGQQITALVPLETEPPYTPAQIAQLGELGWVEAATAGTPSYRRCVAQARCRDLADDVVALLRRVFAIDHPVFLGSDLLADVLQEGPVNDGGPAEELTVMMPTDQVHLTALVATELAATFGPRVMRDEDGDFAVRIGSTMVFARIAADAREVRLFSVVVHDVSGRSRAAEVLNDVNSHARWIKFYLERDRIIATLPVAASPFVPSHFRQAVAEMCAVVDGVDELLASSLEGRVTFHD